MEDNSSEI